MRTFEVGFFIDHDLGQLKLKEKISDYHLNTFKKEEKQFFSTLCKHILSKTILTFYFACASRLNPINLTRFPDTCKNQFYNLLQKPVDQIFQPGWVLHVVMKNSIHYKFFAHVLKII